MDAEGDFVIAWGGAGIGDDSGTFADRYDAAGVPQGAEFQVNTFTNNGQGVPSVAMNWAGNFVIAWSSFVQDGSSSGVYAQRYGVVPEVTASAFHFATAPHKLNFNFDRDVSASLGTDDLIVQNLTTSQTIPAGDFAVTYDAGANAGTFAYTGILPEGRYRATLLAAGVTTVPGAPLAADHVLEFTFLPGDATGEGTVNLADFNILASNFGQSGRDFGQGNFDYDPAGNVNLADFNILAGRFGTSLAPARFGATLIGFRGARQRTHLIEIIDEKSLI
jgi:hypothetical protein